MNALFLSPGAQESVELTLSADVMLTPLRVFRFSGYVSRAAPRRPGDYICTVPKYKLIKPVLLSTTYVLTCSSVTLHDFSKLKNNNAVSSNGSTFVFL